MYVCLELEPGIETEVLNGICAESRVFRDETVMKSVYSVEEFIRGGKVVEIYRGGRIVDARSFAVYSS